MEAAAETTLRQPATKPRPTLIGPSNLDGFVRGAVNKKQNSTESQMIKKGEHHGIATRNRDVMDHAWWNLAMIL
ncbi:hypothetical protein GX50_08636 [[Emmonsia] crescens]|uniref:Uncharacterized protein n=1 Tax=[Emmonsia] crescens TaxID=73230 RepID=A0A2B7Z5W7_9EURO|nr:hypothetical protein GX50_08636 [Emmonsia crescens]